MKKPGLLGLYHVAANNPDDGVGGSKDGSEWSRDAPVPVFVFHSRESLQHSWKRSKSGQPGQKRRSKWKNNDFGPEKGPENRKIG